MSTTTNKATETVSAPESAAAAGMAALDDVGMPTETVAKVGAAVETWNTLNSADSVTGLVDYVLDAVPGFAATLGALGECAPLVGIVFAVLKVAGKHVADVAETKVAYEEFRRAVITTTMSLVPVLEEYRAKGIALPDPVQSAFDQFWMQLKVFAEMLVAFRGTSYAKRLFGQGTHRARLCEVQNAIERALQNLNQAGILTVVLQSELILENQMEAARRDVALQDSLEALQVSSTGRLDKVAKQQKTLASKQNKTLALQEVAVGKQDITAAKLDVAAGKLVTATEKLDQVLEIQKQIAATTQPQRQNAKRKKPAPVWKIAGTTAHFVGRDAELAVLKTELRPSGVKMPATRVAVVGMGGMGKSTLALRSVPAVVERFTRGWMLDGSSEPALVSGLAIVARDLGLDLDELKPTEVAAEVQSRLSQPDVANWLMIVDNVDDPAFKARLQSLLPNVGGCLLVTSQLADWDGWTLVALGKLSDAEATQLLGGSLADAASIATVVKQLDGLAVALEQARAYVGRVKIPWDMYVDKLAEQAAKGVLPSLQLSLRAALEQNPVLATLLQLLQVLHPDDIPRSLLTLVLNKVAPGVDAHELLALLGGFSIVTFTKLSVSLHRLMQEAMRVVAPCTVATVSSLSEVMNGLVEEKMRTDYVLMRSLLVQYEPVLAALDRLSPGSAAVGAAWHAVGTIHTYSFSSEAASKAAFERALAVQEALFGPNDVAVAKTLRRLGLAVGGLGDAKKQKELTERALEINERHYGPNNVEVAATLISLGNAYGALDDYTKQKELLERALAINERHYGPNHPELAPALTSLGNACSSLGDENKAKELHERSLKITERHYGPNSPEVAIAVFNLGVALRKLGNVAGARECMERCLAIETAFYGADHPSTKFTVAAIAKLPRH